MEDKRKPRILHVLKSSIYSGAENVVITIINSLKEDYEFLYLATDGAIRDRLEQEHISFLLLKKFNRSGLRHAILDWKPDIVHAHDFSATVLCASVPGQFRLISHLHYDPPWVKSWNIKTICYTWSADRISKILSVTSKAFDNMVFADRLRENCEIIGNPIDVEKIWKLADEITLPVTYDLLYVGRLVEQKNPQRFLRIVNLLKENGLSIKCAMVGDGVLRGECESLILQYGLEEQVELLGFKENPFVYMKAAKLLCLTSEWEGYGLVILEANILNKPVISSYTAGAEEIMGDAARELCETDEEFAKKITTLLSNGVEYNLWVKRALERTKNIQQKEYYIEKINGIYHNLSWG